MRNSASTKPGLGPRAADPAASSVPLSGSRAIVLDVLERQPAPATLAALSQATALHINTLRDHLEVLESHGRVRRHRAAPSGRGRPAALYEAVPASDRTGITEYAALASALASAIDRRSVDPRAEGVDAGRDWGRALARGTPAVTASSPVDARQRVVGLLANLGFSPESGARAGVVRLTRCPLLEAAKKHPDVVCGVHLGIVEGALQEWAMPSQKAELLPFSETGACRLLMPASPLSASSTS
ncbi:MAG: helix-turn-helix domain-containing protein [Lapillicoccus sp.]